MDGTNGGRNTMLLLAKRSVATLILGNGVAKGGQERSPTPIVTKLLL
jgi:hypothetical protein